jgi:hypothetical protein
MTNGVAVKTPERGLKGGGTKIERGFAPLFSGVLSVS